jgi:hypothetical protein
MTSRMANSAITHSGQQFGGRKKGANVNGMISNIQKANQYALDNKVVTNTKDFTDKIGLTNFLDRKTNGLYSRGATQATSMGYGKPKKHRKKK